MTPYESLMLEAIPVRLSPPPKADRGPTAQWLEDHAWDEERALVVVADEAAS